MVTSETPTMYYAYGAQGDLENTAVGGLALLAGGSFTGAKQAAEWIANNKLGTWGYGNTQSTVQALRLLNTTAGAAPLESDLDVGVIYDGQVFANSTITPETADVLRQFDMSNLAASGEHTLELTASDESPGILGSWSSSTTSPGRRRNRLRRTCSWRSSMPRRSWLSVRRQW